MIDVVLKRFETLRPRVEFPGTLRRLFGVILGMAGFGLVTPPSECLACSICRCGDVTFSALGKAGYSMPGFRSALDWERFDKEEGDPAEEVESQVENRLTALVSYGFGDRLMLSGRVPYSDRDLEETSAEGSESIHTSGFSDPELYGQVLLWDSEFSEDMGRRTSLTLVSGIKTPWGQNEMEQEGERVDEHAQPGTGSTDVFVHLALLHVVGMNSAIFASSGYRLTGDNDYGYRYGNTFLANLAYEHKIGPRFDAVGELNFRQAERDRIDQSGTLDEDTGGALLYVTPRFLVGLGGGVVLRAAAQIPVLSDLNGFQDEKVVANLGVTWIPTR